MSKKSSTPESTPVETPDETLVETPDETTTATAEVVQTAPTSSTALATAAPSALASREQVTHAYEDTVHTIKSELEAIALSNPELGDRLSEVIVYMEARVEGMAGDQQVPIPFINMRQGTTRDEKLPDPDTKMGELYTELERLGQNLSFIPLYLHHSRTKFTTGNDKPDCTSLDGITGSKYGTCSECPYRARDEAAGVRAACSFGYSAGVVTRDFKNLYQLKFSGTSMPAGQKLTKLAAQPTGVFSRSFNLSTKKDSNDKGTYSVFQIAPGEKISGDEYKAARLLSKYFTARHEFALARRAFGDSRGNPNIQLPAQGSGTTDSNAAPDFGTDGI